MGKKNKALKIALTVRRKQDRLREYQGDLVAPFEIIAPVFLIPAAAAFFRRMIASIIHQGELEPNFSELLPDAALIFERMTSC